MADFNTFDLGHVLQTAEVIKGMRRQGETDRLQQAYMGQRATQEAAAEKRAQTEFTDEQKFTNTKLLNGGAAEVMKDPSSAARVIPYLQQKGIIDPSFDWQHMAPEQLQTAAKQLFESTGAALSAWNPSAPPASEPLETIVGPDGKPVLAKRSEAAGKTPYQKPEANNSQPVNQQLITRPVGNGFVQDYAWDPRSNRRVASGEPYKPVTPHTGNVTEGERKAAALGTRLEAALQEIASVETEDPGSSRPGIMERGLESMGSEMGANAVRSPTRQRADTAQLDALDAALTLATGAAYTKEQLQNLRKSYFPQIGDSDPTVAAKQKRFETIVETARIAAGRAEPSIDRAVNAGNAGGQQPQQAPAELTYDPATGTFK